MCIHAHDILLECCRSRIKTKISTDACAHATHTPTQMHKRTHMWTNRNACTMAGIYKCTKTCTHTHTFKPKESNIENRRRYAGNTVCARARASVCLCVCRCVFVCVCVHVCLVFERETVKEKISNCVCVCFGLCLYTFVIMCRCVRVCARVCTYECYCVYVSECI